MKTFASSTRRTRTAPAVIRNTVQDLSNPPATDTQIRFGYGDVVCIARDAVTVYGDIVTGAERSGTVLDAWVGGDGWYIVNTAAGTDIIVSASDVSAPTFFAAHWSVEGDLVNRSKADSAGFVQCYNGITRFTNPTQDELDAFASRMAAVFSDNGHRVRVTVALFNGAMYAYHEENPAVRGRYGVTITTTGGNVNRCSFSIEDHRDRVVPLILGHPLVAAVATDDDRSAVTVGY